MGDWIYYIVRMTMREVASEVQLASDLWEDKTLSDAIQRVLVKSRVKHQIVDFLARRDDRFFSSIVVAALEGNPTWTTIKSMPDDSVGELIFQSSPLYYALDGQHRLKAIQELVDDPARAPIGFQDEQLSVIVVIREDQDIDEKRWLQRYRRLFSSLNRYAKSTDKDTNIIMDEDDIVAIVTRRLITDHHFFRTKRRDKESYRVRTQGKNVKSGQTYFTTLQTLYAMNESLLMTDSFCATVGYTPQGRIRMAAFKRHRPEEDEIDRHYQVVSNCWDAMAKAIPELMEDPVRMRRHRVEEENQDERHDHVLFWPIGQEMFAKVARARLNASGLGDDASVKMMTATLRQLARVPWDLHDAPWRYLLLIPASADGLQWRMRSEDRKAAVEVATKVLRWMVGLERLNDKATAKLRGLWRETLYREYLGTDDIDRMWNKVLASRGRVLAASERPEECR